MQRGAGTESHATPAEALFEGHRPLAERLALCYCARKRVPAAERPAVENAALVGLWQAAQAFDPAAGAPFAAFAWRRVLGEMVDEWRQAHAEAYNAVRDDCARPTAVRLRPLNEDLDEGPAGAEPEPEPGLAAELLMRLPEDERRVLRWIYLRGFCLDVCAARLGTTKGWVTILHAKGLKRLRQLVERQR